MVGEEEDVSGSQGQCQIPGGRRMFWRSASWSSSRTAQQGSGQFEGVNGSVDPEKNIGGQFRKFPPLPLTPRSQQNCKARACLPPLQPLSIARRSLDEWPKAGSDDLGEWPHPPTPSGRDSSKPREGLKLDLATCQKNPDPTASLVNRDRIAYFDKECSKVAGHIYLGGDAVAKNRDILRKNGITHVLNCVGFVCPEYFKADLVYKTLWLQDSPSEDITSILYDVFDYFEDVREQGGRVFVHCCQGVSRSTSLVIAYLMWREGQSFDDAFQYVKAARGIANPNMGFACQLLQCQKRVHAIPLSPSSLLRMYRMAPHSPYDPLHLVPKMLNDPSPCALDSRGAFIVHVPSAIYIWIGRRCEPIMEKDAKGAASQVVRYERVQGQIVTVKEGQEQSKFWDAFCNLPLPLDKSSNCAQISKEQAELASKTTPGDRKVDAYDADFELLEKAITGGVVPPFSTSDASNETHLPARESNWSVLRRRFATSNTKESVSAPRISLFRAYSDSVLIVDCDINKIPSLPADCSTSSSPADCSTSSSPYFSPDSVSSDLSTCSKSSSDSPSLSPPTSSRSRMPSPALSTLSQLSLPSSKKSIFPVCDNVDTQSVTGNLKAFSPSKSFSLSLAQRRGSLSPSLKLPVLNKDTSILSRVVKNESSIFLATKQDNLSRSSSSELHANQELIDFKVRTENVKEDISLEGHSVEALIKESSSFGNRTRREDLRGFHVQEDRDLSELAQSLDKGLNLRNGMSPLVCSWPGFKRVAGFSVSYMDSNSVYLLLVPSANLGEHENRVLYLWIGKSFKHDRSWTELNNNKGILEVKDLDWNQIACNFFVLMSLPEDIPIKVIKEEEEPAEFFDLLKCL